MKEVEHGLPAIRRITPLDALRHDLRYRYAVSVFKVRTATQDIPVQALKRMVASCCVTDSNSLSQLETCGDKELTNNALWVPVFFGESFGLRGSLAREIQYSLSFACLFHSHHHHCFQPSRRAVAQSQYAPSLLFSRRLLIFLK